MKIVVDKLPNSGFFDCAFSYIEGKNQTFCLLDKAVCDKPSNCPYLITLKQTESQKKAAYKMTPEKFKEKAQEIYDKNEGCAGEEWVKEHPVKTRQSEYLKLFPRAEKIGKVINICPKMVSGEYPSWGCTNSCFSCLEKYWLEEISEEENKNDY